LILFSISYELIRLYQQDVDYDVVPSNVYLGEVCSIGNIIHELGHTIGFRHEQARLDRDDHVKINTNKLTDDLNGQYSKMDDSQPNYYNVIIVQVSYKNLRIILKLIKFYNFKQIDQCPKRIICYNGGFIGSNCRCFCPDGLTGNSCETVVSNMLSK